METVVLCVLYFVPAHVHHFHHKYQLPPIDIDLSDLPTPPGRSSGILWRPLSADTECRRESARATTKLLLSKWAKRWCDGAFLPSNGKNLLGSEVTGLVPTYWCLILPLRHQVHCDCQYCDYHYFRRAESQLVAPALNRKHSGRGIWERQRQSENTDTRGDSTWSFKNKL